MIFLWNYFIIEKQLVLLTNWQVHQFVQVVFYNGKTKYRFHMDFVCA